MKVVYAPTLRVQFIRGVREALLRTEPNVGGHGRLFHLDGLRAIALIGVLLFHFKVPGFPGGFLGVDVFFVLSGFLMTRALLGKLERNTFSAKDFLSARARRICPALFATILVTTLVVGQVYPVPSLEGTMETSQASALFLSNAKFLAESGYHDAESSTKPLLHTWSLSVEGQFYLLWTAFALLGSAERALVGMIASSAISIAFQYFGREHNSALFFTTLSRLYQFFAGSIALFLYSKCSPLLSTVFSTLGLLGILGSFMLVQREFTPISLVSLPVVAGTMIIISTPSSPIAKFLGSSRILRYLAEISYSAYLVGSVVRVVLRGRSVSIYLQVHWPVIVLSSFMMENDQKALGVAALATAILSPALYYGVENRYRGKREKKSMSHGLTFSLVVFACIMLITAVSKTRAANLIREMESPSSSVQSDPVEIGPGQTSSTKQFTMRSPNSYGMEFNEVRSKLFNSSNIITQARRALGPYAAVFGDSYCDLVLPFSDKVARLNEINPEEHKDGINEFMYFTSSGCPPILSDELAISNYGPPGSNAEQERKCKVHAGRAIEQMKQNKARTLILVSRWQDYMLKGTIYTSPKEPMPLLPLNDAMSRISAGLKNAVNISDHVVVLGMIPHPAQPIISCLWKHLDGAKVPDNMDSYCPKEFPLSAHQLQWNDDFKKYLQAEHPKVKYLDVMRESGLCRISEEGSSVCKAWDETRGPMHIDPRGHMTYEGGLVVTSNLAP